MKESYDEKRDVVEMQSLLAEHEKGGALPNDREDAETYGIDDAEAGTPTTEAFLSRLQNKKKQKSTPVPYVQVCIIAVLKSSQPLFFGVIMPYINALLVELEVADEVHVGHYSGFIETSAAVGLAIGVFIWARLSDQYGRKMVTLTGMAAACFLSATFGFARSFWLLCLMRFAMGILNASQAATAKVMISEISDATNTSKCFAFLGLGWQTGASIAPMLGGLLSKPAETWPALFEDTILETYPYALPSLGTAIIPFIATMAGFWLLEETHPKFKKGQERTAIRPRLNMKDSNYPLAASTSTTEGESRGKSMFGDISETLSSLYQTKDGIPGLFTCGLPFILLLWLLLLFQIVGLEASQLLLFFSSSSIGGLSLSQGKMSLFLTLRPFLVCMYEINAFPRLSKRFGNEVLFRILICIPVFTCTLYLLLATAAIHGMAQSPALLVSCLGLSLIIQMITNPVFLAADVLIPARAPHSSQLSTVNAFGEIVAQIGIGTGAIAGSSIFAYSAELEDGSRGKGRFVWYFMIVLTAGTALLAQKLTHKEGWRQREQGESHNSGKGDESDDEHC